ncbi:MAG: flagellar motor switch protein FliM [Acidobacteria bacterium]|nr:flagellar motor switch protein FliM [Acidobacteriota bacterium]MBI3662996.1 flagellar motor switch protein FliM [Acidobacteriota bacterium]
MEKILNQEEIDVLFRAAQGGKTSDAAPEKRRVINSWNLRESGQLTKEQVRAVSSLHDNLARNLTHALGAYLRGQVDVQLVSVEQLPFSEFLQRMTELTYIASMNLLPMEMTGMIQMELQLAIPMIELLMGGPGKGDPEPRDITEIEEHIMESITRIICRELGSIWQPVVEVDFQFDQRLQLAETVQLISPREKTMALSFEVRMAEVRGVMNMAVPALISNALLRKLSERRVHRRRRSKIDGVSNLRDTLMECPFGAALELPAAPVPASSILGLQAGQVLPLPHRLDRPALLLVCGRTMFTALPVRSGNFRGAMVQQRFSTSEMTRKES